MKARSSYSRVRFASILALALVLAGSPLAVATPGDLDPTFGIDGKVTTAFGDDCGGYAVAVDGDGRIVVAGYTAGGSTGVDFAVVRYNPDGSLDSTFSGDGKVATDFGGRTDYSQAVALDGLGRIVVAGFTWTSGVGGDFALARYTPNGSLDTTFSDDGKVTTDFAGGSDSGYAVVLDGLGRIVVAGYTRTTAGYDFAVARYDSIGSLDTAFDGDGMVTTDFAGSSDRADAVAVDGDGHIVVAGRTGTYPNTDFALARYEPNGALDMTFDDDGKVISAFGSGAGASDLAHDGDGRILVAGGSNGDFSVARYDSNGALDTAFDGDGLATADFAGGTDNGNALALDGAGRIVVAGWTYSTTPFFDFAVARFNADGLLDTTFGSDGKVVTDFAGSTDYGFGVALDEASRIVVAGHSGTDPDYRFAVARYLAYQPMTEKLFLPLVLK